MSETLRNNGLDRDDERNEFERELREDSPPAEGYGEGSDLRPIREVYGSERNIRAHGSPIERASDESIRYYFYPTWRSQLSSLVMFAVLCGMKQLSADSPPRYLPAPPESGSSLR